MSYESLGRWVAPARQTCKYVPCSSDSGVALTQAYVNWDKCGALSNRDDTQGKISAETSPSRVSGVDLHCKKDLTFSTVWYSTLCPSNRLAAKLVCFLRLRWCEEILVSRIHGTGAYYSADKVGSVIFGLKRLHGVRGTSRSGSSMSTSRSVSRVWTQWKSAQVVQKRHSRVWLQQTKREVLLVHDAQNLHM